MKDAPEIIHLFLKGKKCMNATVKTKKESTNPEKATGILNFSKELT